jgi:hypothetical protein
MERTGPVAEDEPTNDANADAENIDPNINNHPIDEDSEEDDPNGSLDHEMMVDVPMQIETATNDDHPIGAFANGDDVDVDDDVDDEGGDGGADGEDDGIVDDDTTTDSTSEVSNDELSIVGQKLKQSRVVGTRNVTFGRRIIQGVPNHDISAT